MPNKSQSVALVAALFIFTRCGIGPASPLSAAAARGDLAVLDGLLAAGSSSEERGEALISAVRNGQPAAIEVLVKAGADPNITAGVNGWTVLMHAVHKNEPESVRALIKAGADINARVGKGMTALIMAAGYGYTDIVRMLLDAGAEGHAAVRDGSNALDFALNGVADIDRFTWGTCQAETVKLLRRRVPDLKPRYSFDLKKCVAE